MPLHFIPCYPQISLSTALSHLLASSLTSSSSILLTTSTASFILPSFVVPFSGTIRPLVPPDAAFERMRNSYSAAGAELSGEGYACARACNAGCARS